MPADVRATDEQARLRIPGALFWSLSGLQDAKRT
jgi:rhodanese-related sulfurtransferase